MCWPTLVSMDRNWCINQTAWVSSHTSPKISCPKIPSWVLSATVSCLVLGQLLYPPAPVSVAHILHTYCILRRHSCVWIVPQAISSRALSIGLTWRLKCHSINGDLSAILIPIYGNEITISKINSHWMLYRNQFWSRPLQKKEGEGG